MNPEYGIGSDIELSVSEFVASLNQTLEYAYPSVVVLGELANFRVSKNRWVYFDLKDETSSVKFFGTVYQLPGPLEEGMTLKVRGVPKLHQLYGFSVNVISIQPAGEGTIRRAAELLQAKLTAEGLFDTGRKRSLPYPPQHIGLVTSGQSAAYADFIKILTARWQGIVVELIDVQVQGEIAPSQISQAIEQFNAQAEPPDVIVVVRGGGSADDLAAFSTEQVTRAVAASRVPTLVAIGHEIDLSLAELAADRRASTPSNAAELLVPDKREVMAGLQRASTELNRLVQARLQMASRSLQQLPATLDQFVTSKIQQAQQALQYQRLVLVALSPEAILRRGYAIVRSNNLVIRSRAQAVADAIVEVQLHDGQFVARVQSSKSNAKTKGV